MKLPNPGEYNATQSDELLRKVEQDIKAYFADPDMVVHLENADEIPEFIRALCV